MQIDMHYYGTYAMARAAGIDSETARVIATAAQFVDDNAEKDSIEFRDGARLDAEATAHHAFNVKNIDLEDQRKIWVPFHFLPGNEGQSYTQRMLCRKDSPIAQEMLEFVLSQCKKPYGILLVGIAAHVYADTFAHYGFSGISSRRNKIEKINLDPEGQLEPRIKKYLKKRQKEFEDNYSNEQGFLTNIKSWFAESLSGALGHGAAVTFPDRPYLKWSFQYEDPKGSSGLRDNPATFIEACAKLHDFFTEFVKARPDCAEGQASKFKDIEKEVAQIINVQGKKAERISAWRNAAKSGSLFASGPESIPIYNGNSWHNQRENLARERDSRRINKLHIYYYYQAASVYRNYVLRLLLPSKNLIVT